MMSERCNPSVVGIIGAMEIEVANLIQNLREQSTKSYGGISFVQGKINDKDVVVAKCGMGKVNAAMCAQIMLLMYSPVVVINIGVAGSLSQRVQVGDIVIATDSVQHDFDLTPIGFEKGFIHEHGNVFLPCPKGVVEKLESAAQKQGSKYYTGTIATGDQFINSNDEKKAILDEFNAIACEMEGASIAHICDLNNGIIP